MFGMEIQGKTIERILIALAFILIAAFVMSSRHTQLAFHKDEVNRIAAIDQRVTDQRSRLETVETKMEKDTKPKEDEQPAVVENEAYNGSTSFMGVGNAFSPIIGDA